MTKWFARRKSTTALPRATALTFRACERLEPRMLLSASPVLRTMRRPVPQPPLHPMYVIAPQSNPLNPWSSPSPVGVTPAQMRHFYGVDQVNFNGLAGDGTGQTIAVVDAYNDPNAASDLQAFDQAFGLPNPPSFQQVNQSGGPSLPGLDPNRKATSSWEIEESLDIEWAHVIAPKASLVLVEADSAQPFDLYTGASTAGSIPGVVAVSMSFGGPDSPGEGTSDPNFFHSGVTFLAATGDNGIGTYPAYSPNVVAVGGTTMHFAADGQSFSSETAWSGSGGGTSAYEFEPTYQQSVQLTNMRTTPDVAMDADPATGVPVYDSFDFGSTSPWGRFGGTSLSTPMWAGLIAIADQGRGNPLSGKTDTLPLLYSAPSADFHDITSGSNGSFSAGPGYDEVTGIGSPIANKLLNYLSGVPAAPATVIGRYVFYNDSAFDGNNPAANAADDAAIAPDKQALLPGGTATFANYTSYTRGINGVMIDVSRLAGTPVASDFSFLAGTASDPTTWTTTPLPTSVLSRTGAGVNGSTRIEITFADGSIRNQWLQVTVKADANTGLASPDVFYFGNLIGESGKPAASGQFVVTADDATAARNDPHSFLTPATLVDTHDYNRDGRVDAIDQLIARLDSGATLVDLQAPVGTSLAPALTGAAIYTSNGAVASDDPRRERHDPASLIIDRRTRRILPQALA